MSEELDNPRVLRRLAWSLLAAMLAAAVGTTLAMAIHPLVVSLHVKFFTGWGAFLWIELGALICAVVGFTWTWRRLKP
ncbi:MAG TPA: hypothetical protein VGH51_12385 [Candidatus Angelobacter sp.]|jgi:hypothetical protein